MTTTTPNGIFVSWLQYHGRSQSIAGELGIDSIYVWSPGRLIVRYWRQWRTTVRLLRRANYDYVIVMQPPSLALLAACWATRKERPVLVADMHTGAMVDSKWRWQAGLVLRIARNRGGFAIVTNSKLAQRVEATGAESVVLHDVLAESDPSAPQQKSQDHILFPVTYAEDEPIEEILEAARQAPELKFVLTGRAPATIQRTAPRNIEFTGYVSNDRYVELLKSAAVVCALTTRDFTMQRAGYEALTYAIPLVTSSTETLREYFGSVAIYADPTAQSILHAITTAYSQRRQLHETMSELRKRRIAEDRKAIALLKEQLLRSTNRRGIPYRDTEAHV